MPDAESVSATCRYGEDARVGLAHLLPGEARRHIGFVASPEAPKTLICDRAKPKPAFGSDAGRWIGQGAVFIHEGPEVLPDAGLGTAMFHDNIMAAI